MTRRARHERLVEDIELGTREGVGGGEDILEGSRPAFDADRDRDRITIETAEREPREVAVDTAKFSDLSLGYALHVYKAQGITTEASGILTGGWQTDKESTYVALSRAREQTQVYVTREDLGEQGMDTGAIERLGERMRRSGAQEASIAKEADERGTERRKRIEREIDRERDLDSGFGIE